MRVVKFIIIVPIAILLLNCCKKPTHVENGDDGNEFVTCPQVDIPWPSLADSPWPMSTLNAQGLARTNLVGAQFGSVVWAVDPGFGKCDEGPAIGPDNSIYLKMHQGFLALNADGTDKWSITSSDFPRTGVSIDSDHTIYGGSFGFRAYRNDGTVKWDILSDEVFMNGRPLIGIDGTVYTKSNSGNVYAISPSGNVLWTAEIGFGTGDIIASPDGLTLYVPGEGNTLNALNAISGIILWTISTGIALNRGAAVDNQGNIYFPGADEKGDEYIFSIDAFGSERWKYPVQKGSGPNWAGVNIDYNGNIYTGWHGHGIIALDYNGNFRWQCWPDWHITDSPIFIDSNNDLYIMCQAEPLVFSYDSDGTRRFKAQLLDSPGGEVFPAAILSDGKLIFGTQVHSIVCIN